MSIELLPNLVIARICAGEAVSNPASILKELLDNAIDSGATKIQVTLNNAGLNLIQVQDNGTGIATSDLPLLARRHHTSKHTSDIHRIASLGFRGEALSSIVDVASVEVITQQATAFQASKVQLNSAPTSHLISPTSGVTGTTVSVTNLFHKTPVRLKFLNASVTEEQHAIQTFWAVALAYPEKQFQLTVNGKIRLTLTPETQVSRLTQLRTGKYTTLLLSLEQGSIELNLTEVPRSSHLQSLCIINRRPVTPPTQLHNVITKALDQYISPRFRPFYVLNITLPLDTVDLHTHPAKKSVRIAQEAELAKTLQPQLIEALQKAFPAKERQFNLPVLQDVSLTEVLAWQYLTVVDNLALFTDAKNLISLDLKASFRRVYHDPFITQFLNPDQTATALSVYLTLKPEIYKFYLANQDSFSAQGLVYDDWNHSTLCLRSIPGYTQVEGSPIHKAFLEHMITYIYDNSIILLENLDFKSFFQQAPQPDTPAYTSKDQVLALVQDLFKTSSPQKSVTGTATFKATPLSILQPS